MTREELKVHCEKQIENCEMWARCKGEKPSGKVYEEHKLILELLEQEPCEDCISRQAVIEGLRTCYDTETKEYSDGSQWINYEDAVAEMENLPSVTPQPKIGRWIFDEILDKHYYCSECKSIGVNYWDYCPYCGAKMEVEE